MLARFLPHPPFSSLPCSKAMADPSEDGRVQTIRAAVSADGPELETADEQKLLLHVWEKLQRTEDALRDEIAQHRKLKKEREEDVAGYKEMLGKIQDLSEQKNAQLNADNVELNAIMESIRAERDAFEAGNQAIVQLLMERGGVHHHQLLVNSKDRGDTLKLSVERLVNDMESQELTIGQLEKEGKNLSHKKEQLEIELQDLKKQFKTASMGSDRKEKRLQGQLEASQKKLKSCEDANKGLSEQLQKMRGDMKMLTGKLESMTATQTKVHRENVSLRRSIKQKEDEIRETRRDTVPLTTHNQLKEKCDELEKSLAAKQQAHVEKLRKVTDKDKHKIEQLRQELETARGELEEVKEKLETTSQQVHSLQRDLHEKELENQNTHQTLQKLIKEEQEAQDENRELKRQLGLKEENQNTMRDRLRKESTSLKRQKEEREGEVAAVTRELQELREVEMGLQLDKESLSQQLKRTQEEVGGYQVRLLEMEQFVETGKQQMTTEQEAHHTKIKELEDRVSTLDMDKRTLSEKLDERIEQHQKLQHELRTERDAKDQLRSELQRSQIEARSLREEKKKSSSELEQQLASAEAENLTLQQKIDKLKAEHQNMVLANTKATGAEEVLRRIEKDLRLKLQEREAENHSLVQKATEKSEDTARLTAEVKEQKEICKLKQGKIDSLQQEVQAGRERLAAVEAELSTLHQNISHTTEEKSALEGAVSTMCGELENMRQELAAAGERAKLEMKTVQDKLDTAEPRLVTALAEKEDEKKSSQRAVEELKTKVEMLEQRLTQASQVSSERADQLGHTERKFSEQIETLRQKLSTVEAQKQREREELSNQLKELSATLSHAQQELQSREQELEVTKARLSETERMCSESGGLLDREKSSTVNLQQQLTEEKGTTAKFREQLQELVAKNATTLGAQKKLEAELTEMTKQKRRADSKLAKIQTELEVMQREKNQLQQKVEALNAEISEFRQKLAELQVKEKAMIEGEHKIESLQHELASIGEKLNENEVKGMVQEQKLEREVERASKMKEERGKMERELREKETELTSIARSLQAKEHHVRLAEEQIKRLEYEKEQLHKELALVQQVYSQQMAGVEEWRDSLARQGRRRAERKLHDQERLSSYREKQHRKKLSLEWEVVRLCEDLESAGRQLEAEARWREKAAAEHKIQLAANTNLRCKINEQERVISDHKNEIHQLRLSSDRMQRENQLLEQENSTLASPRGRTSPLLYRHHQPAPSSSPSHSPPPPSQPPPAPVSPPSQSSPPLSQTSQTNT